MCLLVVVIRLKPNYFSLRKSRRGLKQRMKKAVIEGLLDILQEASRKGRKTRKVS